MAANPETEFSCPPPDGAPGGVAGRADVVIIGGGPAGSTAGILLAERGYHVVLLEKARHPRFHIGESLLPANLPLLEELGVGEQVRSIGMEKWGAEFVSPWHGRGETFLFADAWKKSLPYAYQVRRSDFDQILIRRAAECGVEVIEGCRAREVRLAGGAGRSRVEAEHEDGRRSAWDARFIVDASGRDTLLANQLGAKRRNPRHRSAALYGHFRGAERYAGRREGHITVYWFEHGWFWFIPLADGVTSVGAVVWPYYLARRTTSVQEFFLETIRLCKPLADRLAGATLVAEVSATGNYSYVADRTHGVDYLLLGDAYTFIDPVFSSGVWLAMHSAVAGAEAIDCVLRKPARAAAALRRFDRSVRRGPRQFSWFIYRVTTPGIRELFMNPRNPLRMKEALLSVLAGDIYGRTPIRAAALNAFKAIYYLTALLHPRLSIDAWLRRRRNLREAPAAVQPGS